MELEYEFEVDGYIKEYTYEISSEDTLKYVSKFTADWLVKTAGRSREEILNERNIVKNVINSLYYENEKISEGLQEFFMEDIKDLYARIAFNEMEEI